MRTRLKIAYTEKALELFGKVGTREAVLVDHTDFTDVGAILMTGGDRHTVSSPWVKALHIPIFLIVRDGNRETEEMGEVYSIISLNPLERNLFERQIESAVARYEDTILPPFFKGLLEYVEQGNSEFDCPGHQGGAYFRKHPAGRIFYDFYGENTFRGDLCNADVAMGDLLIHEGPALAAQKHAARVFNADKAYFILNGTSGANKVVMNALLTPGDLVLYERNNHKSVGYGALIQAGAIPIYLETARNPFGLIGGVLDHCFNEEYIRMLIAERDPKRARMDRPLRAAVIQLGNYDGCIYNARQVVEKIGHLCDYIVFDSAWVGYEQFIPMMKDCSPLLLDLGPEDPGIIVTQSIHKQQAGFSQASMILKKDSHIKGQKRYVPHKIFNNSFMVNSSTSPNYQIFASLDMNAKIQEGEAGRLLWHECMVNAIEARKKVLKYCKYLRPIVPPMVHGKKWEEGNTEEMADDISYFAFEPGGKWHSFQGYRKGQYFIDPMKLQLMTPGINMENGEYEDFGIPGIILADYLRDNRVIPEKCDLNDILFLMTPAETKTKLDSLITKLVQFEHHSDNDSPMEMVLPTVYNRYRDRYEGYTIRRLCRELHDFYKERKINVLQKKMFLKAYFPAYFMSPQKANWALVRGQGELIPLEEAEGRVALQGAVPYPPGVTCVQPGERWSRIALDYFLDFVETANILPGVAPELQGVYLEKDETGKRRAKGYVLMKEYEKK
ncbi:ornithine decarboxylase [uncultured Dialister sp.]|uniref:ornithine decarboxylase n=1 Tax=uncultured Dialister sp. TaxID=278064 RepID=UPI00265F3030|nr:ornithine decarboxylase [uncultured Dialister sp.]